MPTYDKPTKCTGSARNGLKELWAGLKESGQFGLGQNPEDPEPGYYSGIYNCKKVQGSNSYSAHAEGRALDISYRPFCHTLGKKLFNALVENAGPLGVQYIVYCGVSWGGPNNKWYVHSVGGTGGDHNDHLHVELNKQASSDLTKELVLQLLEVGPMTFEKLGGQTNESPSSVSLGEKFFVYVRGTDGRLYEKVYNNGWGAWTPLGHESSKLLAGTGPSATVHGGEVHVTVTGTDKKIYKAIRKI